MASFVTKGSQVQILPLRPNKIKDLAVVCRSLKKRRPPIRPPKQSYAGVGAMAIAKGVERRPAPGRVRVKLLTCRLQIQQSGAE
jgi:hypothetical protein